jgi:hypothetical protein
MGNARFKTRYGLFGNWVYKFPQLLFTKIPLESDGHCRTGLEEKIICNKTRLAKGNEELIERLF